MKILENILKMMKINNVSVLHVQQMDIIMKTNIVPKLLRNVIRNVLVFGFMINNKQINIFVDNKNKIVHHKYCLVIMNNI